MCNLYSMTPKEDVERYVRKHLRDLTLPDYAPSTVGPFGNGLFIRPDGNTLRGQLGQWGLIGPKQAARIEYIEPKAEPGKKAKAAKPKSTNNARIEGIEKKRTFAEAWRCGRRCLIPATWYAEPNWETHKCLWWHLTRLDGSPWFIAGLWSEWIDPTSGELVPNFTMITTNCDGHPFLARLHKPELDPITKEVLPPAMQDKRSLVHVDPDNWDQWLQGTESDARELIKPQPAEVFDMADALRTDQLLTTLPKSGSLF
jgi:putative SOS response-associated peptidase YedK